jgi:hypothetical protein
MKHCGSVRSRPTLAVQALTPDCATGAAAQCSVALQRRGVTVPRSPLRQRIDVEQGKVQLGVTREPNRSAAGLEKENGFSGAS